MSIQHYASYESFYSTPESSPAAGIPPPPLITPPSIPSTPAPVMTPPSIPSPVMTSGPVMAIRINSLNIMPAL